MTEDVGGGVDEDHGGACDLLVGGAVAGVVDEGLVVGGDPEGDGAVDLGDDAGVEGEDDCEGCASDDHLAEEALLAEYRLETY